MKQLESFVAKCKELGVNPELIVQKWTKKVEYGKEIPDKKVVEELAA